MSNSTTTEVFYIFVQCIEGIKKSLFLDSREKDLKKECSISESHKIFI